MLLDAILEKAIADPFSGHGALTGTYTEVSLANGQVPTSLPSLLVHVSPEKTQDSGPLLVAVIKESIPYPLYALMPTNKLHILTGTAPS